MERLFLQALTTAGILSVLLAALLFPGRKWLVRRYAPQVRWRLSLGMAALLLLGACWPGLGGALPSAVVVEVPNTVIDLPVELPALPETVSAVPVPAADYAPAPAAAADDAGVAIPAVPPAPAKRPVSVLALLGWGWLTVAAALLTLQLLRYGLTRRRMLRASTPLRRESGVWLRVLPGLDTPLTLGYLAPVVFLPREDTDPMAVRHELAHIRRGDLWGKAFVFLACAVYWFDPLVWYMARVADRDMESACDAQVVRDFTREQKRSYGALLLSAATARPQAPLATQFGGSKRQMKARLTQLFHPGKQSRMVVAVLLTVALAGVSLVSCRSVDPLGSRGEVGPADLTARVPAVDKPLSALTVHPAPTPTLAAATQAPSPGAQSTPEAAAASAAPTASTPAAAPTAEPEPTAQSAPPPVPADAPDEAPLPSDSPEEPVIGPYPAEDVAAAGEYFTAVRSHLNAIRSLTAGTYTVHTEEDYADNINAVCGHIQAILSLPEPTLPVVRVYVRQVRDGAQRALIRDVEPFLPQSMDPGPAVEVDGQVIYYFRDATPEVKWMEIRRHFVVVSQNDTTNFLNMERGCLSGEAALGLR